MHIKKIAIWRFFNFRPQPRFFYDPLRGGDSTHHVQIWSPCARENHACEYDVFLTVDKFFLLPFQILLCVYLIIPFTKKQIFYLLFTIPNFSNANTTKCQQNNIHKKFATTLYAGKNKSISNPFYFVLPKNPMIFV